MRVVISAGRSERVFSISNPTDATTLEQILAAGGYDKRDWSQAWVDGKKVEIDAAVADIPLLEGSLISNYELSPVCSGPWQINIISGLDTGAHYCLNDGDTLRVGRSPEADITIESPSLSWSHCFISVRDGKVWVKDDNSSNGTYLDGNKLDDAATEWTNNSVISAGGACLRLERNKENDVSSTRGTVNLAHAISFNRPPRPALPKSPEKLEVPKKKEPSKPSHFSWVMVLTPLVMALAMVLFMGSMRYALFALLSPLMAVGSWWDQKRRAQVSNEEEEENYLAALERFREDINAAADQERERLRAEAPDPVACIRYAQTGSAELWQVRHRDADFLTAQVGTASVSYEVPVNNHGGKNDDRSQKVIDSAQIPSSPVTVELGKGAIGIWGDRTEALRLARSLVCQVATRSGNADVTIGVFTDKARSEQWRWTAWLPQTRVGGANPNDRWLALKHDSSEMMLRRLRENSETLSTSLFLVVDDTDLLLGRDCPARDLFAYQPNRKQQEQNFSISGIVIAPHADQLPASCHTVVEAKVDAQAKLVIPSADVTVDHITTNGITQPTATEWARALARYEDPETRVAGASLPSLVQLFSLLGLTREVTGEDISALWQKFSSFNVPLGVSEQGIYWFDLVKDGPHGLVGGTTGSGKSELLRSLVAGLAARIDPEHLTFILIDFKGGAAFATLDQLPHTIGTLSNLEASLAYRALKALEAEMRYRQECFAAAGEGIDNLDAYLATNPTEPMPRLLVVVDEFAQLAKEFPDVLKSLVSIGAVGRTLGVHMILATQRPAGVVNDDILANTNMRVALRVQSREDSANVIGVAGAASIGREQKGRAYVKLGEDDITPIQTALVTGISDVEQNADLYVDEIELAGPPPEHETKRDKNKTIDMDLLIAAIKQANDQKGFAAPRPVWPEPLGERVNLELFQDSTTSSGDNPEIPAVRVREGEKVVAALADDPDRQRQIPLSWDVSSGNLLLAGIAGSGTTTALKTLALSLASTHDPANTDFLFLDMASHSLNDLEGLPHSRGYAGPGSANRELQHRLLRYLYQQLDARTSGAGDYPDLYVFVDGLATMRDEYDEYEAAQLLQAFFQVWAKGPSVGIHCAATTTRAKSIPSAISEVTTQIWLFHLAELYDYSLFGVAKDNVPAFVPGRFVDSVSNYHAHIATYADGVTDAIETINEFWHAPKRPQLIANLPTQVDFRELQSTAVIGKEPWSIPVGIAEVNLQPYSIEAWGGEHLLIAGPARSGKSTLLQAIGEKLKLDAQRQGIDLQVYGTGSRRSPILNAALDMVVPHSEVSTIAVMAQVANSPTVLLIDDAHMLSDADQSIAGLLGLDNHNLLIVAAGRSDDLRKQYGQWTATLRKSLLGVLLQPNTDFDGELLGVRLPRHAPVSMSVGRGYACQGGTPILVQSISLPVEED